MPLQIHLDKAIGLALEANVAQGKWPALRLAVVYDPAIFHRTMIVLAHVVQHNPGTFILGHGKAEPVSTAAGRHAGATLGITKVAELAQLMLGGDNFLETGVAGAGESCPQRQTGGKRPTKRDLLRRKEERTRHNSAMLARIRSQSKDDSGPLCGNHMCFWAMPCPGIASHRRQKALVC